jgi:hypothetical protein
MARDLIPPPSPAGKPTSQHTLSGGVPNLIELPPEPPRSPAEPAQKVNLPPSQFRNRFGFLMGALAGVLVAAGLVVVAVLAWGGSDNGAGEGLAKNWSRWTPADVTLTDGAQQIADHVGAEYHHANGQQLTKVTGGPLGIGVALRASSGQIKSYDGQNGVLYTLNGLGANGSIKGGTPSTQRLQLVRREALELALYTFRYLPDADMVVTLLPPPPPKAGTDAASPVSGILPNTSADPKEMTAVFYRPGDLKQRLQIPLGATLGAAAPPPEQMGGTEGQTVDSLTLPNLFNWSLPASQVGQPSLVLDRISG